MAAILKQLGEAVSHLHKKCIVHCDLCPENILIDCHNVPKIGDFGLGIPDTHNFIWTATCVYFYVMMFLFFVAVTLEDIESTFPWTKYGHELYRAPEMEKSQEPSTSKIDIYALGLIFLRVICAHLDVEWAKIHDLIKYGKIPELVRTRTKQYTHLLCSMFNVDPAKRMNAPEVVSCLSMYFQLLAFL